MSAASVLLCSLALVSFGVLCGAQDDGFKPTGKFDLSPQDIKDLCVVVDGQPPPMGTGCVYMKWVPCEGEKEDPARPCGWYQQTLCENTPKTKREIGSYENAEMFLEGSVDGQGAMQSNDIPYISFPY